MDWRRNAFAALFGASLAATPMLPPGSVAAATGDVLKVTADRANLRAGPSERSDVRGQVQSGDDLIELRRQGEWIGVRIGRTGEEGWIYSNLVQLATASTLGGDAAPSGFKEISPGFDSLVRSVDERNGFPMVARVETSDDRTLRVTPTREWLLNGDGSGHVLGALAFYGIWKSQQEQQPVTVLLLDEQGREYITIRDGENGPSLTVRSPGET
jgi:hypothetical protein